MAKIRYSNEFICPKCGKHTALVCRIDGTYQAHCMICDVYYDVEIAKHRKRAKEKQSIKSDHRDWPQAYAWRDCSKCENLFCENSGECEEKNKFAYCDHYREGK